MKCEAESTENLCFSSALVSVKTSFGTIVQTILTVLKQAAPEGQALAIASTAGGKPASPLMVYGIITRSRNNEDRAVREDDNGPHSGNDPMLGNALDACPM